VLRTFADTPREEGELTAWTSGFLGHRWGLRLEVTGVVDPDDDQTVRIDGSYVAGKFGNWIVTLGAQERWWGSGYEGSLILSNNARPVPAIALGSRRLGAVQVEMAQLDRSVASDDLHGTDGR
jgi:hypothetical protein